eukprot:227501_1
MSAKTFITSEILTDVPPSHKFDENKLLNYLRNNIDIFPPTGSLKVYKFGYGQSNPTYLLQCGKVKLVLRKKPSGPLAQGAHAIEREYRVMSALQNSRVPVPRTYLVCTDTTIIGQPFYICAFINGRIFPKRSLPSLKPNERFAVYAEMNRVLSAIHSVNLAAANLKDFSTSTTDHFSRTIKRWNKVLQNSSNKLIKTFCEQINKYDKHKRKDNTNFRSLVHGDFKTDNIIFDAKSFRILAVIDWELSCIGNPLADLTSFCYYTYFADKVNTNRTGIPQELDFVRSYIMGLNIKTNQQLIANMDFPIQDWSFYCAVSIYKGIGIVQGIADRIKLGNASDKTGKNFFGNIKPNVLLTGMAAAGLKMLNEPNIFDKILLNKKIELPYYLEQYKNEFKNSNFFEIRKTLIYFMNAYIYPYSKKRDLFYSDSRNKWKKWPGIEFLKSKAKELNLWNLFLPEEYPQSPGLTNLEYAPLAEIMGTHGLASVACNCSAPDTGNMEVLAKYGSKYQKDQWLKPLMEGKIRSCFGMTEPAVASSDARNIECSITKSSDGEFYYVNGRKHWTSGALGPDCKICILMGKTDKNAATYFQQSMLIVPMNSKGVKIVRHLKVFGYDHNPNSHGEVVFDNVKVPKQNMILGEGRGFEIAQGRLGPGRIHHCMRLIGMSEVALNIMRKRVLTRYAFGRHLYKFSNISKDIASSRCQIEQLRLLVLQTAALMDRYGAKHKRTRQFISMIKVVAANVACDVIDKAIQAYGGLGVSQDPGLAHMWALARTIRLADGPDAVHARVVAREDFLHAKL